MRQHLLASVAAAALTGAGGGGGDPDPDPVAGYVVTVASGKVGSNLSNYPLMIDLRDMPGSFWDDVRTDGGNIRAYAADGTTLIPHDVTYINKSRELGRMFVKTDLLAASDNEVVIKLLDSSTTKLSNSDTNGRNAVWADYEVAWVFPDAANRSGKSHSQTNNFVLHSEWIHKQYYEFAGNPHQGLAVDASGNVVTIDTNYLRRYDDAALGALLASNADPVGAVKTASGKSTLNHLSDGCIIAGELWIPVSEYPTSGGYDEVLAVFNLSTLALDRYYDVSSVGRGVSGICYNPDTGLIYGTDYSDGTSLMVFNTSGVYQTSISLSTTITLLQGIEWVEDHFILSSETGANLYYRCELDGTVTTTPTLQRPQTDINEGISYDGTSLWTMDGGGDVVRWQRDPNYADWRKAHYTLAYAIAAASPTYQWSMGCSFHNMLTNNQRSIMAYANGSSSANWAALVYDEGPDVIGIWNSTDGWMWSAVNPDVFETHRYGLQHNGTTARKMFIDGTASTDTGCANRPGGTGDIEFVLNGAYTTDHFGDSAGEGYYQTIWLRHDVVSNDWYAADAANNNSPSTFYSIAEAA